MATPVLSPSSVTVPNGGSADVRVTWNLDPGTPAVDGTLTLAVGSGAPVSIPVRHDGRPAEVAPRLVTTNPAPGDVLVTCDVASVSLVDQGTIRLA